MIFGHLSLVLDGSCSPVLSALEHFQAGRNRTKGASGTGIMCDS